MTEPGSAQSQRNPQPLPAAPQDPFIRFNARVLDPSTAGKLADGSPASVTAYVSDRLLVTAATRAVADSILADIDRIQLATPLRRLPQNPFDRVEGDDPASVAHNRLAELLNLALATGTPATFPVVFRSLTEKDDPPAPEDVWPLLRRLRHLRLDRQGDAVIGLDHLMFASATVMGNPVHPNANSVVVGDPVHPNANAVADASYTRPGFGGRVPVSVVLPAPTTDDAGRLHVVVLDTGVGDHDWFHGSGAVGRSMDVVDDSAAPPSHHLIGLDVTEPDVIDSDPEAAGAVPDLMTGQLASHAGHGTFIAGLLRQTCPQARITGLRIMDADGVVPEWELSRSVMQLAIKQHQEAGCIDALVLSLGYYSETGDQEYTAGLKLQLLTLARRGVVTFAAAGNDCTQLPSYPAAFAADSEFQPDHPLAAETFPLVSVAALNPDHTSVALFSNDGSWVNGQALGANVVSTAPKFGNGSTQSVISVTGPGERRRSTIDPDDYSSGFATWSGTSFAAPILAGRYLAQLVSHDYPAGVSGRRDCVPLRK